MFEREPPNRCPYPKPFPAGFADCPAYQPVRFIPMDTQYQPLEPIWSCAHLDLDHAEGRPYTSCRLGTHSDRVAWADRMQAHRLEVWRAMAREFGEALKDSLAEVYAAKAEQLEHATGEGSRRAERRLREAVERFLEQDFELMDARAAQLAAIGFPVEAMKVVTAHAMESLVRRKEVFGGYEPPAELLAPFSAETREFVRSLFAAPPSG